MERWWRLIQVEAMSYIRSRKAWDELNDVERHYIAKIMCALSDEFFDVLDPESRIIGARKNTTG